MMRFYWADYRRPVMLPNPSVIVANKEPSELLELRMRLERSDYAVREVHSERDLLASLVEPADAVVLDDRVPESGALWLLGEISRRWPDTLVLLTSAAPSPEAPTRINPSAFHYTHRRGDFDAVLKAVDRALQARKSDPPPEPNALPFDVLIGRAQPMTDVKQTLRRIASAPPSSVLLTGESGTGKDLAAKLIHYNGERATNPFVTLSCTGLSETLLGSELFGHEAGAVPGAAQARRGLLEVANGGTIVLDAIGDLPQGLQGKLLRFLEERSFRRIGGVADIHVDVRVIAMSSRDLELAVERGSFRVDLYYRLSVLRVLMPALRDRAEDVPAMVEHFVDRFRRELRSNVGRVTPKALEMLSAYPWPGNVRELGAAVERAVAATPAGALDVAAFQRLALPGTFNEEFRLPPGGVCFEDLERDLVIQALERTGGNQTRAATLLGMNRDQIRYRIQKFGLERFAPRRDSSRPPQP